MKIEYPISEKEAKYYLSLEVEELSEDSMDKIIKFFQDNIIDFNKKQVDINNYISREELKDKISSIAYDAAYAIESELKLSIEESIKDAFR